MDVDSFVNKIKTDFYKDTAKTLEIRFDTSGYSKNDNKPLLIGKNKKVIGMTKEKMGGEILAGFVALRAKMYAYRNLDITCGTVMGKKGKKCVIKEDKKCKGTKKVSCGGVIDV